MTDFLPRYIHELRERAEDRRREGAPSAQVYERVAEELEARRIAFESEEVSLTEAQEITGYSKSQLQRLLAEGKITLQRGDLPKRPKRPTPIVDLSEQPKDLADRVLRRRFGLGNEEP